MPVLSNGHMELYRQSYLAATAPFSDSCQQQKPGEVSLAGFSRSSGSIWQFLTWWCSALVPLIVGFWFFFPYNDLSQLTFQSCTGNFWVWVWVPGSIKKTASYWWNSGTEDQLGVFCQDANGALDLSCVGTWVDLATSWCHTPTQNGTWKRVKVTFFAQAGN